MLGRAHGELAGAAGAVDGLLAAVAAPAAAAAAPAVATPGVTELLWEVGVAAAPVLDDAVSVASSTGDESLLLVSSNAPVRAPAALAGADFFRPSRSRIDFFGGVLPVDPVEVAPSVVAELIPDTGAGPGSGDGTGEAEPAERGAEAADVAEPAEPYAALGPDAALWADAPGAAASDAGPVTGVAEAAERAE